jgi:hypothetical protein
MPGGPAIGACGPVDAGLGGARGIDPSGGDVAQILRLVHVTRAVAAPLAWRPRLLAANRQDQVTAAYLDGH